jgi:hypothetical protein
MLLFDLFCWQIDGCWSFRVEDECLPCLGANCERLTTGTRAVDLCSIRSELTSGYNNYVLSLHHSCFDRDQRCRKVLTNSQHALPSRHRPPGERTRDQEINHSHQSTVPRRNPAIPRQRVQTGRQRVTDVTSAGAGSALVDQKTSFPAGAPRLVAATASRDGRQQRAVCAATAGSRQLAGTRTRSAARAELASIQLTACE